MEYRDEIKERLNDVLEELSLSPLQFSRALNYKGPIYIYKLLDGTNYISDDFIARLLQSDLNINPMWLVHNKGSRFFTSENAKTDFMDELHFSSQIQQ